MKKGVLGKVIQQFLPVAAPPLFFALACASISGDS